MIPRGAHDLPRDHLDNALQIARRALRHAWVGGAALVICLGVALIAIRLKPSRYLSQEVLYYQEGIRWDSANDGHESSRHVGNQLKEFLLTRTQLQQVILDLGLYPRLSQAGRIGEAVDEMLARTTFRVNDGSTFTITFVGESAADAQRTTARLSELVIAEHVRQRSQQVDVAKRFLDEQTVRSEELLREKEEELAHFLAEHPDFLQEGSARASAARLAQQSRAPAPGPSRELLALRRQVEVLRQRMATEPAAAPDPELIAAERQTKADLEAAQRAFAQLRPHLTESHPDVVAAAKVLKSAEEAHRQALEALRAGQPVRPREIESSPPEEDDASRHGKAAQQDNWREATQAFAGLETEFARLTRAAAEERDRFQRLDARRFLVTMATRLNTTGSGAQVRIIDPAFLPVRPVGPSVRLLILAGLAASIVLGFAVALAAALLDDRIYQPGDVDGAQLGPVLVEVPRRARAHGEGDPRLILQRAPDSASAAAFRVLRHRLTDCGSVTSILVTSPGAGEGKTTCALNLALALGEGGRARVLLLDADFRRPALGALLGLAPPDGPGQRPASMKPLPWAAVEPVTPWLDVAVMRPGAVPPVRALRSRMEELRAEGYRWIVIDGPAVLGTADVNMIDEGLTPRVLMAVWRGRSRTRGLRAAVGQLGRNDRLGVVLMGA